MVQNHTVWEHAGSHQHDLPESHASSFIGVILAVIGSMLIGISYTASKNAHNNVHLAQIKEREAILQNDSQMYQAVAEDYSSTNRAATVPAPLGSNECERPQYSMLTAMKQKEWWWSMMFLLSGKFITIKLSAAIKRRFR
jgi:hypothetical protein